MYYANKMIITCTVRDVVKQLSEGCISISLGKVMSLRPFLSLLHQKKKLHFVYVNCI